MDCPIAAAFRFASPRRRTLSYRLASRRLPESPIAP